MDDESFRSLLRPLIQKVMEMYQPDAVVFQCGADSLSGDRLGCFNFICQRSCRLSPLSSIFQCSFDGFRRQRIYDQECCSLLVLGVSSCCWGGSLQQILRVVWPRLHSSCRHMQHGEPQLTQRNGEHKEYAAGAV